MNVLGALVNGLSRSNDSCLIVSVRSTTPVVMLAFRDLKFWEIIFDNEIIV